MYFQGYDLFYLKNVKNICLPWGGVMTQFTLSVAVDVPRPLVHNSITPYEQKVSRTANIQ